MGACAGRSDLDAAKQKVHLQNKKLHHVVATKNVALLEEVYAEDAHLLAPGMKPVQGREQIIALWKEGLQDIVEMRSEPIEVGGTVDVLYEVGIVENKVRIHNPDSVVVHKAKYNNVWKRDAAGEYRLVVDIWNNME